MSTFVSVGNANQPFSRLLQAVSECAELLPQPIVVQCGHTPFDDPRCQVHAFLEMEQFVAQVRTAEVVIVHAGAGSVLHAIRAGKKPIVMPRRAAFGEHVDDHQLEFARELSETERVIMVESVDELSVLVSKGICAVESSEPVGDCRLLMRVAAILRECQQGAPDNK